MKRVLHPRFETLVRFAHRGVGKRAQQRVAEHLTGCTRCRAIVAGVHAVGDAARQMHVPLPPDGMLARISAERDAGVRALLPSVEPVAPRPRAVRPGFAAAAVLVLAIALGWVALRSPQRNTDSIPGDCMNGSNLQRWFAGVGLAAGMACAQDVTPPGPAQPVTVGTIQGQNIRPGTWRYEWATIFDIDTVVRRVFATQEIRISDAELEGEPAWLLVSNRDNRGGDQLDSTYLTRTSLQPMIQKAYLYRSDRPEAPRMVWEQSYTPDEVQVLLIRRHLAGEVQSRSIPLRGLNSPLATGSSLLAMVGGLPLGERWTGSVAMIVPHAAQPLERLDLYVVGSASINVVAGTFECWVVDVWVTDRRDRRSLQTFWIRKRDGVVVRMSQLSPPELEIEGVLIAEEG